METRDIPEDVWNRARRIWVSDLESCPRQRQHRILGTPQLPDHFVQVRGSVGHQAVEQILKGEPLDLDYSRMPEAQDNIEFELDGPIRNMKKWVEETEVDLENAETEVSIEMELRDGYVLVGKIDLLTQEEIVDFKTGPRRNTQSNRTQLVAYQEMAKALDDKERQVRNVFLGGEKAVEIDPFEKARTGIDATRTRLEELINDAIENSEKVLAGYDVPCKLGFLCSMCRFRAACSGL